MINLQQRISNFTMRKYKMFLNMYPIFKKEKDFKTKRKRNMSKEHKNSTKRNKIIGFLKINKNHNFNANIIQLKKNFTQSHNNKFK